jgi:predicted metal-dependent enzyme (double-stranded beta helix superfamily)
MFDIDNLIQECRGAIKETDPRKAVREVLLRTLDKPGDVAAALARKEGGLDIIHCTDELTVLNAVWAPHMNLLPHDHRMWAVIGIYGGTEDNSFYRRGDYGIERAGGRELHQSEVIALGVDAIHSVKNPERIFTGAIHVYGGDFVNQPRSQWDPDTLIEKPYEINQIRAEFARANEAWARELTERDVDETVQ